MNMMCAWRDCYETCEFYPDQHLPDGWRYLTTSSTPVIFNDKPVLDRDAVLCPGHVFVLNNTVLKAI